MQSGIIFLGTAGDGFVVGKQLRASGGIIIQDGGYQFHLDPGPGALVKAKEFGVNLRETTAVLVSHAHLNHYNDMNAVLGAMSHNGLDVKGVLVASESILGNEEKGLPSHVTKFHKKCVEKSLTAYPGKRIGIENVEIQTFGVEHSDAFAVGFKLFMPNFVLTYPGDTKYSKELVEFCTKSDILILNTVFPRGTEQKERNNLTVDDTIKILQKAKPQLAILTHFGRKMLAADPLYESREVQKATGIQVLAATDGMVVNPLSYAASARQKTLQLYKH